MTPAPLGFKFKDKMIKKQNLNEIYIIAENIKEKYFSQTPFSQLTSDFFYPQATNKLFTK